MIRTARVSLALTSLALAAISVAGCEVRAGDGGFSMGFASGQASDEWKKTYTIAAGGTFEVTNVNGTVTVEQGEDTAEVDVRAERIAKASSDEAAQQFLKQIEIREDVKPDAVRLETKVPSGWRGSHEVRYFIKVPKSIKVQARTTNGGVRLNGLANEVVANAENGGIKAVDLSGPLDANTTNGGVDVALAAVPSDGVRLQTVNGGVQVQLPKAAKADISAHVVNGGVHVDDQLSFESTGEKSRRRLEGHLNGGGSRIELATTNGGIHITGR
jgi:hypothetical protein